MRITISNSFTVIPMDNNILGYMGEMRSRIITVSQPNVPNANSYKLRFKYSDGVIFDVPIVDDTVVVESSLLREVGDIHCQWLATRSDGDSFVLVAKSNIFTLQIRESIGEIGAILPYEVADEKVKEITRVYNSLKRIAYDNTLISQNYGINPVVLKIPGSVEYVKDGIYSTHYDLKVQTATLSNYSNPVSLSYTYLNNSSNSGQASKTYINSVEATLPTIRHLILEEGVKQIGWKSFYGQVNLDRIEFPESLEWVHPDAFLETQWENEKTGEIYCGNVFYKYKSSAKGSMTYTFTYNGTNYTITTQVPSTYSSVIKLKDGCKSISSHAFSNSYQNSVSNGYTSSGLLGIKEIVIPDGFLGFGDRALEYLGRMYYTRTNNPYFSQYVYDPPRINLPDSIVWIGEYAFNDTRMEGLKIPPKVDCIRKYSFCRCNFKNTPLHIHSNVKSIRYEAFYDAAITHLTFDEGVEYIDAYAFAYNCSQPGSGFDMNYRGGIGKLILPEALKYIGYYAFAHCDIYKLHLPSTLEYVDSAAFTGNTISELTVGKDFNCTNVVLPSSCNGYLSVSSMESVIENLAVRRGMPTGIFSFGSNNVGKLSSEVKQKATFKNWTIS